MPRWGLADRVNQPVGEHTPPVPRAPAAATVRTTLFATVLVLAVAALVYLVRYVLLIINRNTLLNPLVAGTAVWLGVVASLAAAVAVIACAVVLTRWLIARRATAFAHYGLPEPRSHWALWVGCVVPLVNLLWAPVYVIELATLEGHYSRLRKPILLWWLVWVASAAVSIVATATSPTRNAQGIGNNTVTTALAYLLAAAVVAAVGRVFEGFERKPVERPAHRWVVVPADLVPRPAAPGGPAGQEPAA
ncbi:MAG: DUF4328 domain-containing protein [Mycobacterium sp.]|nr:DUF4328 domain-containing protein [Mycobacterium sp.]MDI3313184.1 DUF4328 domain-containing protein [Mycobacterium sp.]